MLASPVISKGCSFGRRDYEQLQRLVFRSALLLLVLIAFLVRLPLLQVRDFDPDEFQHLHSAYSINAGFMPYRDFFEHHTPWLHFFLSGIATAWGDNVVALFAARRIMLVFTMGILYLTYRLGRLLYGAEAGLIGACLLSYTVMFLEKTLEIRPDTAAVTFWLVALFCFVKGVRARQMRWYLWGGLAMGSAVMFTQKSLFALAGLGLALLWAYLDRRIRITLAQNLRFMGMFFVGLAIPMAITSIYFSIYGALDEFINFNFLMNFQWKMKFLPHDYMLQYVSQNPFVSVWGCAGLVLVTFRLLRRRCARQGEFAPVIATYTLIASLYVIPVPYRQYYLFFLPLLALFAAVLLLRFAEALHKGISEWRWRDARVLWWVQLLALYLVAVVWEMLRAARYAYNIAVLGLLCGIVCVGVVAILLSPRMRYVPLVLMWGLMADPFNQMLGAFLHDNTRQLAKIQYILDHSTPKDTVLDGWSGYGVFRPHAYFYYFLHDEMLAMLNDAQKGQDIIDAVERERTKFVIYDKNVRMLPKELQVYIRKKYSPTGLEEIYERNSSLPASFEISRSMPLLPSFLQTAPAERPALGSLIHR